MRSRGNSLDFCPETVASVVRIHKAPQVSLKIYCKKLPEKRRKPLLCKGFRGWIFLRPQHLAVTSLKDPLRFAAKRPHDHHFFIFKNLIKADRKTKRPPLNRVKGGIAAFGDKNGDLSHLDILTKNISNFDGIPSFLLQFEFFYSILILKQLCK